MSRKARGKRELAKLDENRRAVGVLHPRRDKKDENDSNEGKHRGEGKTSVTTARLARGLELKSDGKKIETKQSIFLEFRPRSYIRLILLVGRKTKQITSRGTGTCLVTNQAASGGMFARTFFFPVSVAAFKDGSLSGGRITRRAS